MMGRMCEDDGGEWDKFGVERRNVPYRVLKAWCLFDSKNEIVGEEAWRYTCDEDGNMVERRCRATLLVLTKGTAEPLPARNEVNPRAEVAQAGWSLPGKDYVQSVETIFEPASFEYVLLSYSSSGLTHTQSGILYGWMSREANAEFVYYVRPRYYQTENGQFTSRDTWTKAPDDEQWIRRIDIRNRRYKRMVYGEGYDQWNDYGAEKVMLFIALHTGQAHPYSWPERGPEPDPTGHTLLAGCLRGAASGGAGCFVDVLFSNKEHKFDMCAWIGCGVAAIGGCITGAIVGLKEIGIILKAKVGPGGVLIVMIAGPKIANNECCSC